MRILLADENRGRARALSDIFAGDPSLELVRLVPGQSLIDAVSLHGPDVVLVDISRPDRDALDSVRALAVSGSRRPVVLFVDEDDTDLMEAAFEAGVCSYNVVDTPPKDVKPLLRAAIALYDRFRRTEDELRVAQQQLSDRATVDRAKAVLMRTNRMSEPEAYRWLRRRAMDQARKLADVAEDYLRTSSEGHEG
ncbi:ANTAR domain-containing response regulator [Beijerinckia indica]|uniref:Response regulator receiver and ANTAR domain protein n=1 Tax=Beijerinckia indica subsp. indica (strain ATCC 9039 / DSM 1715 / NCIMB 8712) TaxID=395963 RepID=B2IF26_BEII9|nr:ANTAR domain-containing protein [Beijerinckia indica]ACB95591.1 response regulator receiver and ANTAR domain protein [Beijerinckia indica subsp. indica ATCC 9039]